ncbi:MAG: hypothetical protein JW801_19435 [Bacteroidales bacterium]|nr:hypothetical protein [Bacteroidales bacterium]
MQIILTIFTVMVLAGIFYFDLRYLAVPTYLVMGLILLTGIRFGMEEQAAENLMKIMINIVGTLAVLLTAIIVLFIRKKQVVNPVNRWIGAADLLLILVLCLSFSPVNYLVFFILSSFLIITIKILTSSSDKPIPLAGMQSLLFAITLILARIFEYSLYNDTRLLILITGNAY